MKGVPQPPPRVNLLGVGVHALDLATARDLMIAAARARHGAYVCCCDAHSLVQAQRLAAHRRTLNRAFLATPDGMPLVWLGRRAGHRAMERVYGPDLLLAVCAATASPAYSHFLYGAGPGTAAALAAGLQAKFPGLRIAGTHTPPFGPLPGAERAVLAARLQELRPDFFWVGLSTPKQEAFMAAEAGQLEVGVMAGVGAAFDLLTGRVRQAPRWLRQNGLEWLWRLAREPRRLGPRYLRTAPRFAVSVVAQLLRLQRYPLNPPAGDK